MFLGASSNAASAAMLNNTALDRVLGRRFNTASEGAISDDEKSNAPSVGNEGDDAAREALGAEGGHDEREFVRVEVLRARHDRVATA